MIGNLSALMLGVMEGLTEFLPISSTAHLVLASDLLGIAQSNFAKTFEIAIQSGAILAVLALYWRKFLDPAVLKKLLAAFLPTAVIGLAFYKLVKTYLLGNTAVILAALAAGGALMIAAEYAFKNRPGGSRAAKEAAVIGPAPARMEEVTYQKAFSVGLFQSVAMVPGVSRSAATILGGMLLGISRETIVEFSFLLAVPTMLAATALDLLKNLDAFSSAEFSVLAIGAAASFVTAIIGIKLLLRYIKKNTFIGFGVYRIALAVLVTVLFLGR